MKTQDWHNAGTSGTTDREVTIRHRCNICGAVSTEVVTYDSTDMDALRSIRVGSDKFETIKCTSCYGSQVGE